MNTLTLREQNRGSLTEGFGSLSVKTGTVSPYFRTTDTDRTTRLIKTVMRAIVEGFDSGAPGNIFVRVSYLNGTTFVITNASSLSLSGIDDRDELIAAAVSAINAYATSQSYNLSEGIHWPFTIPADITALLNSLSTVATTGSYNDLTDKPTIPSPYSISTASRSLDSAFQISSARNALVSYSVDIATSITLVAGEVGTIFLEFANESGFTTGVTEVARFVNGQMGTLTIGLALDQTATGVLTGVIPAGKYVRIRTENTTGTPTFTYRSGQETLV